MNTGVRINFQIRFQIIFTLCFDQDMTLAVYISFIGITCINTRGGHAQQLPNISYNKTPIQTLHPNYEIICARYRHKQLPQISFPLIFRDRKSPSSECT
jgi:hypothetical protein